MPRPLDPLLEQAIAAGELTEAQALDVEAFADGILARVRAGELTRAQARALTAATAIRDARAELAARARARRSGGRR